jgi:L-glyceraldehyde 3-phosphate reductase
LTETTLKRIKALNDIAENRGQSLAEMSLAWILDNKLITSVIVGASSTTQLEQNLKAINSCTFSQEELEKINMACSMT